MFHRQILLHTDTDTVVEKVAIYNINNILLVR